METNSDNKQNAVSKTLLLIDGHALAFRMFFALERTNMQTTEHTPTWAVYGFFKAIFDLLKQNNGLNDIKPDSIAVAFDVSRKTFRLEKYEGYKANRETMPDSLRPQFGLIMEGLNALNIPIYTKEGFEGDDIIGTIAKRASELKHKTYILTGDKDSLQLIDKEGSVSVLIPSKGELVTYDWDKVYEKLGVFPNQVIDYKALCGDTSDNIPGVKGIGPKTACSLLEEYKTLENVYEHIDDISKKSVKEKLIENKDTAYLSQFLATIKRDVDIDFDFENTCLEIEKKGDVIAFFNKVQFFSFVKNIDILLKPFFCKDEDGNILQPSASLTAPPLSSGGEDDEAIVKFKEDNSPVQGSLFGIQNAGQSEGIIQGNLFGTGENNLEARLELNEVPFEEFKNTQNSLNNSIAFLIEGDEVHFADDKNFCTSSLTEAKEILENPDVKKITYDIKGALEFGIKIQGVIDDVMLSSYVKDSSRKHDIASIVQNYLRIVPDAENKKELAGYIYSLHKYYEDTLSVMEKNLVKDIELPLSYVLHSMETEGVCLDTAYLKELSKEINGKILGFEKEIYEAAGTTFNINSPKQVGDVLFNVLKIKPGKKNKTGYSTNAKILEDLAQEHKIASDILEHRTLMKLKTTYVDNLPKLLHSDNKLHTHFNQIVTTTGRLSSSDPNLQNIPIRTEFSNRIRAAFIPCDENHSILAADYSQIELRLLAHVSEDEALVKAFCDDVDIHTVTAAKIFDVSNDAVTKEMRRKAKAVNFGLIYGQTRYGLASALGITPYEAQVFIDKYFKQYPKINTYITNTLIQAHETGYVETIYGRKRYLGEELNSRNAKIREFAERAAVNAPLQGSAADLIKMAMNELYKALNEKGLPAKMLLQVHDELVLEVRNDMLDVVKETVIEAMELGQPLLVPLKADVKIGKTWKDSK